MWIPTPVYERVPQFWLLLGLLFIASGAYLGFDNRLSFVYIGVGFVCTVWSLVVIVMRRKDRSKPIAVIMQPEQPGAADSSDSSARAG